MLGVKMLGVSVLTPMDINHMNDTSEVKFCLRKLAMLELEAIQAI
jgi:hypothetical protein